MSIEAILESIEKLTLLEAAELVKAMEEKFGVSAAAPVAVAAAAPLRTAPAPPARYGRTARSETRAPAQPSPPSCPTGTGSWTPPPPHPPAAVSASLPELAAAPALPAAPPGRSAPPFVPAPLSGAESQPQRPR